MILIEGLNYLQQQQLSHVQQPHSLQQQALQSDKFFSFSYVQFLLTCFSDIIIEYSIYISIQVISNLKGEA